MEKVKGLKKLPKEWKKCKTNAERKKFITKTWHEYKMIFWYFFFGGWTFIVNVVTYAVCADVIHMGTVVSNIIAWVFGVVFAYVTNRKWVFESQHHTAKSIIQEVVSFVLARVATGVLDLVIMVVSVDLFGWSDVIMKIIANIIVIILNYVASRLWVFSGSDKKS